MGRYPGLSLLCRPAQPAQFLASPGSAEPTTRRATRSRPRGCPVASGDGAARIRSTRASRAGFKAGDADKACGGTPSRIGTPSPAGSKRRSVSSRRLRLACWLGTDTAATALTIFGKSGNPSQTIDLYQKQVCDCSSSKAHGKSLHESRHLHRRGASAVPISPRRPFRRKTPSSAQMTEPRGHSVPGDGLVLQEARSNVTRGSG